MIVVLQVASLEPETLGLAPGTLPDKSRSRIGLTSDLHSGHIQAIFPLEDGERATGFAHRGLGCREVHFGAIVADPVFGSFKPTLHSPWFGTLSPFAAM